MSNVDRLEQKKEAHAVEEQQAAAKTAKETAVEPAAKASEKKEAKPAEKTTAKAAEKKAPAKAADKKPEQKREVVLERKFNVPLFDAYAKPAPKRGARAIKLLREFLQRHMKAEDVKIDPAISRMIMARGITNPPKSVRVKASKDKQGVVLCQSA